MARSREESREAWQFRWLQDLASDLRHALRACRRSPAFTVTAVLSLALGIGGTSAIYTALDAALWKPLPVADPDRLVGFSISREKGHPDTELPAAFVNQLRASGIFDGVIATSDDGLSFSYDGRAERILADTVMPDYFSILGVPPMLGQCFTPEVRSGHWAAEAVLSYNFWQRRFGGDPTVIGRTIRLNTYPFTIVGVSPRWFFGMVRGTNYELRIPMLPPGGEIAQIDRLRGAPERWLDSVARLKAGVTIGQAQAAADAQFQEFLRVTPMERFHNAGLGHLRLSPAGKGYDEFVLPFRDPLYVLLALVGMVLLIACSNVANMLLARAAARSREFAIRTSIGAGRLRLIRQMLAESLLLFLLGGALGLAIAWRAADLLFHFLPQGHIHIDIDLHPDRRALLLTLAISLVTGILFGLAPAVQATRGSLASALKNDSSGSAGEGGGVRFRKMLVISQVALSLALLIGAGVFVRTLTDLRPREYRNPDHLLLFTRHSDGFGSAAGCRAMDGGAGGFGAGGGRQRGRHSGGTDSASRAGSIPPRSFAGECDDCRWVHRRNVCGGGRGGGDAGDPLGAGGSAERAAVGLVWKSGGGTACAANLRGFSKPRPHRISYLTENAPRNLRGFSLLPRAARAVCASPRWVTQAFSPATVRGHAAHMADWLKPVRLAG